MVSISTFTPPENLFGEHYVVFTTSVEGGVSKGAYQSLNLAQHVGDDVEAVRKNRSILASRLNELSALKSLKPNALQPIKWLNQQHTCLAVDYEGASNAPCDAIFTSASNTPLAIMTADCLPIVLVCEKTHTIAAIHAGWRGLLDGVIENTVAKIDSIYLKAWIGPSIQASSFQVRSDVIEQFAAYQDDVVELNHDSYSIDLPSIARKKMLGAGVKEIHLSSVCSYINNNCFSHRRAQHQGFKSTGRMATVVCRLS